MMKLLWTGVLLACCVGCGGSPVIPVARNEGRMEIVSEQDFPRFGTLLILRDTKTGGEFLMFKDAGRTSLCPVGNRTER